MGVAADPGLDQMARKVGARDQLGVADKAQGPLKAARDAHGGELIGHFLGALLATATGFQQTLGHARVVRVKAKADNVHGFSSKRD